MIDTRSAINEFPEEFSLNVFFLWTNLSKLKEKKRCLLIVFKTHFNSFNAIAGVSKTKLFSGSIELDCVIFSRGTFRSAENWIAHHGVNAREQTTSDKPARDTLILVKDVHKRRAS